MPSVLSAYPTQLRLPGQNKPNAVPRIDWTHPLARGLLFYAFDVGAGPPVDLVAGCIGVANASSGTKPSNYVTPFGAPQQYNGGNAWQFQIRQPAATGAIGSIVWSLFAAPSAQASTGLWSYDMFSNTFGGTEIAYRDCEYSGSTGSNKLSCYGGLNGVNGLFYDNVVSPPITSAANTYITGGVVCDGSNRTLYAASNGTITNCGSVADVTNIIAPYASLAIGDYPVQPPGSGAPLGAYTGSVFFWALFNRTLTLQEVLQLHNDPYCFLIPAEPEMQALMSPAVVAAGSSGSTLLMMGVG